MRGSFLRGSSQGSNNAQGVSTALAEFQEQKTRKNGLSATAADSSISALTLNASSLSSGTCAINKNAFNSNQNTHQHSVGYGANVYGGASTNPQFAGGPSSPATSVSSVSWASANANGSAAGTANAQSLNSGTAAAQAITVGDGDAETRPDAVGVRYLIKY
jgi:hypothetical protein